MNAHEVKLSMAMLVIALVSTAATSFASSVAPDETPLLFDRVRTFETVVVVTLDDGFEKQTKAQPNSNGVILFAKIEKTLKGALKPGATVSISCHEQLPVFLSKRDAGKTRRYLLVLKMAGDGYAYLAGGMLYTDLDRFLLCDDSLEAVAASFMAVKDDDPDALLAVCLHLLGQTDLTEAGCRHVNELLTRIIPLCGTDEKAKADSTKALAAVVRRMAGGLNIDTGAGVLAAYQKQGFEIAQAPDAAKAGAVLVRWLENETRPAAQPPILPDYLKAPAIGSVIQILGVLKPRGAPVVLLQVAKDSRWPNARLAAIDVLGTLKAEDPLRALLKEVDRPGAETVYNKVVDALTVMGKGEGLTKKEVAIRRLMME